MPSDPDVIAFIEKTLAFYPADSFGYSTAQNRALYDRYAAAFRAPRPVSVATEDFTIAASEPARMVPARRYRSAQHAHPDVAVLYLHGGGFVLGGLDSHDDVCAEMAATTGIDVVSIDYRLAPEHLHPAQLDDAEAAYLGLGEHYPRLIVAGDSAGGNLAAALCLRCKAHGHRQPVGQILIYPGLGGDANKGSYLENAEAPLLTRAECLHYAKVRSGGVERAQVIDPEISPLLAGSFSGLAPAFIVTADIDPLRDDGSDYAALLTKAGVAAEHRNEPDLVHGYLRARTTSRRAAESFAAICAAVSRFAQAARPG
ncbi:MAG: alpha/beta hydrolase [Rhizobiales bacterium]|nr:alpha/beta hydrolase [Hyphomicrobiales bacterium]